MFKFTGIVVGASIVLFVAVAWLNPEEARKTNAKLHGTLDQAVDQITEQHSQQTAEVFQEDVGVTDTIEDDSAAMSPTDKQPQPQVFPQAGDTKSVPADIEAIEPIEPIVEKPTQQWHIFWLPFSSKASAQGFAERINQETGLNIKVMDNNTGRFRVAFGYHDEADRQTALETIENKTGLKIEDRAL